MEIFFEMVTAPNGVFSKNHFQYISEQQNENKQKNV